MRARVANLRQLRVASAIHEIARVASRLVDVDLTGAVVVARAGAVQRGRSQSRTETQNHVVARIVDGAVVAQHAPQTDLARSAFAVLGAIGGAVRSVVAAR